MRDVNSFHSVEKKPNSRTLGETLSDSFRLGVKIIDLSYGNKVWVKLKTGFFAFSKCPYICLVYIPPVYLLYTKKLELDIFWSLETDYVT